MLAHNGKGRGEGGKGYNLIVRRRRVIPPGALLHDAARDGLKVQEVVALLEEGHLVDALEAGALVGGVLGFFRHDRGHVHRAEMLGLVEVFVEGVWRVDRVELFRGVFALGVC